MNSSKQLKINEPPLPTVFKGILQEDVDAQIDEIKSAAYTRKVEILMGCQTTRAAQVYMLVAIEAKPDHPESKS